METLGPPGLSVISELVLRQIEWSSGKQKLCVCGGGGGISDSMEAEANL